MSSGNSKGMGWSGKGSDFLDQLVYLDFEEYLDLETEYDVYVGKGGPGCVFYHHYIVLESPQLPTSSNRLIFELSKTQDAAGRLKVVPSVREFSCDGDPDYKITVTTTLRWLAELASQVIGLLGPYNLITASCQTFSDQFLKQLGSSGYMTYVKTATAAAVIAGLAGAAAYWLFSGDKKDDRTGNRR